METLNPVIIFAALAIIFAVLNLVLWTMVWKNFDKDSKPVQNSLSREVIDEIKNTLAGVENNSKTEDQLWGILDKLKDLEEKVSSEKAGKLSPEIAEQLKRAQELSKKSAVLLKEEIKQIKEVKEDIKQLSKKVEGVEDFGEMFESLDGNIAKFNNRINQLSK
ncbi:MAG: hypothetical protein PF545_07680 [Elusimicrobia bacterium]|jgi:DNA mismatch repair ATPase MutS|nr:hypothetical protein [Elusimicrobiota bacterium]